VNQVFSLEEQGQASDHSNFDVDFFGNIKFQFPKKNSSKLERITSLTLFLKRKNLTHHFDTNWTLPPWNCPLKKDRTAWVSYVSQEY
jgi:hypothetical protein